MTETKIERGIVVFAIWAVFGFIGVGFITEGLVRDGYLTALIGIAGIALGFVGHLIVNFVFGQRFTNGETALGLVVFGAVVLSFILGWLTIDISETDFHVGLTLVSVVLLGAFAYVATRYGVRGAFSAFHLRGRNAPDQPE